MNIGLINVFMRTKVLLSDESKWTKSVMARDIQGVSTLTDDPNAVCWSLTGAIHICGKNTMQRYYAFMHLFSITMMDLPKFNDNSDYDDVIGLLDKAIAKLRGENQND